MELTNVLAGIGLVLLALGGGTFWSFSTGVMPGLARTDDPTFVTSMRAINRTVVNPLFLLPILLPPIPLVWAGLLDLEDPRGWLLAAAGIVYFFGAIVVTAAGNVPLNNALDSSTSSGEVTRAAFERRWNVLNGVRSASSVVAIALAVWALLV
ncbi:putative membrane protein [Microbacterium sp. ZKA21]|uniref:anthrone oxygenase family protein n=1 Tax=Microbacterium sp. ZKA21 TaxID=3381694 RepID=UPI003D23C993